MNIYMSKNNHNQLLLDYCQSLNHYENQLSKKVLLNQLSDQNNFLFHVLNEKYNNESEYKIDKYIYYPIYNNSLYKHSSDYLISLYKNFVEKQNEYYTTRLIPKNASKLLYSINNLIVYFKQILYVLQTIKICSKNKNKIKSVLFKMIMNDFITSELFTVYPHANKIIDIIYDELLYNKSLR